jgi:hypothetical protein
LNDGGERREAQRIAAGHAHAIIFEVEDEGIMVPGALFPHDLSIGGVRGKWERPLPSGEFRLRLEIAAAVVDLGARVAWERPLPGGAILAGVSFIDLSDAARGHLSRYLEALQTPSRRRAPRFSDVLPVEILCGDQSLTAIASDMSVDGLQLTTDETVPACEDVLLLLPLTWDVPLEVPARVRWRRTTPHGGEIAGLEFGLLQAAAREGIEAYLRELSA